MLNIEEIVYIDKEQSCLQSAATSFYIAGDNGQPKTIIYTGKSVLSLPVKDKKEKAYQILANDYDVHSIFNDMIPQIIFYPVPYIAIFAFDSFNGYFGTTNPTVDIFVQDAPIYYIDEKLSCYYLSPNLHEFLNTVVFCPNWKEQLNLGSNVNVPYSSSGRSYLIDTFHLQAEVSVAKDIKKVEDTIIIYPSIEDAKKKINFYNIQKVIGKLNNSTL